MGSAGQVDGLAPAISGLVFFFPVKLFEQFNLGLEFPDQFPLHQSPFYLLSSAHMLLKSNNF